MMTFGSLFSGCGGMDGGLEDAGLRCAWQVEIDRSCQSVLARHWPIVPRFSDITTVRTEELHAVDLIAGGSPCQDLSVAGRREGLDGERSRLFHHLVRIADSQPSAWVLWENVPGALFSNGGRDFGIVIRELSGFWPERPEGGWRSGGFCAGQKRWLVWRVLDSQYFGVPQRRRRVFVVAGPRDGRPAPEVLLEYDSLPGGAPPSSGSGSTVAALLGGGTDGRGWRLGADDSAGGQIIPFHLAQITSAENRANPQPGDPAPSLNGDPRLSIVFTERGREGGRSLEWQSGVAYTLTSPKDGGRTQENRIALGSGVRRLTPREWERLQGFPDDWTRWDEHGRELKDSPRYRMIGNGVTRTVARWIGERIALCRKENR